MSRTDKDAPTWVRALRMPPGERNEYHAHDCESAGPTAIRRRHEHRENVVGVERVRKTFIKMVDSRHVFFGAEMLPPYAPWGHLVRRSGTAPLRLRIGVTSYYLVYDEQAHPGAVPVERDLSCDTDSKAYVIYTKWVEVPEVEVTYVVINDEVPTLPCGLTATTGESADCYAYPNGHHRCSSTKEMRREGYTAPERNHVRGLLREALTDYNTYGETEIEPDNRQPRRAPWGGGYWD